MPKINEELIRERIQACKESQEFAWQLPENVVSDFIDTPARNLALLKGTYWDEAISRSNKPRVGSNQILPKWQANRSTVSAGETEFLAVALTPDAEQEGTDQVVGSVISQVWAERKIDAQCKMSAWDCGTYGFGVVEVGWRFKRGKEILEGARGEAVAPENSMPLSFDEDGVPYTPEASPEVSGVDDDNAVWGNPTIDDPYVERFSPRDLLVDRNTTRQDLSDCRTAFRRRYVYVDKLKADKRLKNTRDLHGSIYQINSKEFTNTPIGIDTRDDSALVRTFDGYTWIFQSGKETLYHIIYTDETDDILLSEPMRYVDDEGEPLFGDNPFPFRIMPGMVVDNDAFYQPSVIQSVADLQIAFDEGFDQLNNIRRKSVRQWLVPESLISDPNVKDDLESGKDGLLIPVEGDLNQYSMMQVPYASGSNDLYKELQEIPTEIGRQIGTNEFQESQVPDKKMLATEVNALAQMGNARTQEDTEDYDRFREDIAYCVFVLIDKFGDRTRYFNRKDGSGKAQWGQFNNTALREASGAGEGVPLSKIYNIKINASSTRAKNKGYEVEKQAKLMQMLQPFMMPSQPDASGMPGPPPLVDARVVLRGLLKAFDVDNIDEYLPEQEQGTGDPMQDIAQALTVLSQYPPEVVQQVTAQLQMMQAQGQGQPGQEATTGQVPIA